MKKNNILETALQSAITFDDIGAIQALLQKNVALIPHQTWKLALAKPSFTIFDMLLRAEAARAGIVIGQVYNRVKVMVALDRLDLLTDFLDENPSYVVDILNQFIAENKSILMSAARTNKHLVAQWLIKKNPKFLLALAGDKENNILHVAQRAKNTVLLHYLLTEHSDSFNEIDLVRVVLKAISSGDLTSIKVAMGAKPNLLEHKDGHGRSWSVIAKKAKQHHIASYFKSILPLEEKVEKTQSAAVALVASIPIEPVVAALHAEAPTKKRNKKKKKKKRAKKTQVQTRIQENQLGTPNLSQHPAALFQAKTETTASLTKNLQNETMLSLLIRNTANTTRPQQDKWLASAYQHIERSFDLRKPVGDKKDLPVHLAVEYGLIDILDHIIQMDAECLTMKNGSGQTPAMIASAYDTPQHRECADFIAITLETQRQRQNFSQLDKDDQMELLYDFMEKDDVESFVHYLTKNRDLLIYIDKDDFSLLSASIFFDAPEICAYLLKQEGITYHNFVSDDSAKFVTKAIKVDSKFYLDATSASKVQILNLFPTPQDLENLMQPRNTKVHTDITRPRR